MRNRALIILVLGSITFGLGVLVVLPALMMRPMVFDAPGASASPGPWLVILGLLSYPLLVLLGLTHAWLNFRRQAYGNAMRCILLPALGAALAITAIAMLPSICRSPGELGCF